MKRWLPAICLLVASVQFSYAEVLVFNTSDSQFDPGVDNQGWWANVAFFPNQTINDNYTTGSIGSAETRSFFTFDLSGLNLANKQVTSATLRLRRFIYTASTGPHAFEKVSFFDVSTPAAVLNANTGMDLAIFNDLGSGASYGAFNYPGSGSPDDVLVFNLNAAALVDIAAAAGGFFSIGAVCTSCQGADNTFIFDNSWGEGIQQLQVEVAAVPTPEPASILVLTFALPFILGRGIVKPEKVG